MLAFNQYIVTKMDNESINFAIDVANSVLFQIAADNNCNKVVRYGHKKRTVKFYEGRKLILLVQIIRCTVIHEDQTEEHHYHELLPDILLPFLQYTAASFAILKYSSDKAANMAEQDKPIWCRLITIEQWSVYMDLIADCSPSKVAYLSCEDSEQRLANRSREAADLYLLTQSKTGCDCDDSIEGRFQRWYQEQIEEEAVQKQISLSAFKHQLPVSTKTLSGMAGVFADHDTGHTVPAMLRYLIPVIFASELFCMLTIETGIKGRIFNPPFYIKLPDSSGSMTYPVCSSDRLFRPPAPVR